jgi:antitoxin (DNA-binding transcriptional repressor) of toxin-antitoxin stability system
VPDITATEASRSFADMLDAVEHRGETFTIVRRGKVIAQLEPARTVSGARVKELIRRHRVDADWIGEVSEVRSQLVAEERF